MNENYLTDNISGSCTTIKSFQIHILYIGNANKLLAQIVHYVATTEYV